MEYREGEMRLRVTGRQAERGDAEKGKGSGEQGERERGKGKER